MSIRLYPFRNEAFQMFTQTEFIDLFGDDEQVMRSILNKNGWAFSLLSPRLRKQKDLIDLAFSRVALNEGEDEKSAMDDFLVFMAKLSRQ